MGKNTPGYEGKPGTDPLQPITSGEQFVADHFRFWLYEGRTPPEQLPEVVVLTELSEHAEANPDLKASIAQYPPMRSEMPLINLGNIVEQIRIMQAQQPES